jgi:uncharacterized Zn finger protein (UPF0148 family)
MSRPRENTAALAMQLHFHMQACSICRMPIDLKAWDGIVLCPLIGEWLDLHFPEDRERQPDTPETVAEKREASRIAGLIWEGW